MLAQVCSYNTKGKTDFSGLQEIMSDVALRTNPAWKWITLMQGKRILWCQNQTGDASRVKLFIDLEAAACDLENPPIVTVVEAASDVEAVKGMVNQLAKEKFDLAIVDYTFQLKGRPDADAPLAAPLMVEMRYLATPCPVIVFASESATTARNKSEILALGASHFCTDLGSLFLRMGEVLTSSGK